MKHIKRRQFTQNVFALFSLPMLMSACGKEENITPNGKSVVVVGAGIAGLAAAQTLYKKRICCYGA